MKRIPLTQGRYALIDDDDYETVKQYKWHLHSCGYARTTALKQKIFLHRLIKKTPGGTDTDHINGNRLDNRKSNLRLCTRSQNIANQSKPKTKNYTSIYKGVSKIQGTNKWQMTIRCKNINFHIQLNTELQAALAYDLWAITLFGEYAKTNFPVVASL